MVAGPAPMAPRRRRIIDQLLLSAVLLGSRLPPPEIAGARPASRRSTRRAGAALQPIDRRAFCPAGGQMSKPLPEASSCPAWASSFHDCFVAGLWPWRCSFSDEAACRGCFLVRPRQGSLLPRHRVLLGRGLSSVTEDESRSIGFHGQTRQVAALAKVRLDDSRIRLRDEA
jgi:hypothetical protein